MDSKTSETPGYLINRAGRLLVRRGEKRFASLGLAIAQLPVLVALKHNEVLSQKELAKIALVEQPTMAQLLSRMERDGLITRTPDPDDKRSSLASLTPVAREKLPAGREILIQGNKEAMAGFSNEEIDTLCQLLRRVIGNLENTAESDNMQQPSP